MEQHNSTSGQIITFYSYKGGTGRSMALANSAYLFAQNCKPDEKTLLIDWDLEAPGLHQFFHGKFRDSSDLPDTQLGLIDLFVEIREFFEKNKDEEISDVFFEKMNISKYIIQLDIPSLFLIPAGRTDDNLYANRVNEFNWGDFFDKNPLVIPELAKYLRKKYKYTLIDSRTGYTDISGICTSIMPEKLVVAFTPNRQSLTGIVEMIHTATAYRKESDDLRPLVVYPLPSRIENAENQLQKEWRFGNSTKEIRGYQKLLETALTDVYQLENCDLTQYFDEIQIQYVPKYSYGEELSVLSERIEDRLSLARSFESFTEILLSDRRPWDDISETFTHIEPSKDEVFKNERTLDKGLAAEPKITDRLLNFIVTISLVSVGYAYIFIANLFPNYHILITIILWILLGLVSDVIRLSLDTTGNFLVFSFRRTITFSQELRTKILQAPKIEIELHVLKDISAVFKQMVISFNSWANNFLYQVIREDGYANFPNKSKSIFERSEYAGQNIIGSLVGFLALLLFLYADAAQGAQTFSLLFNDTVPPFLNNIVAPLIVGSAGSAIVLGIFIGDMFGFTHLGLFSDDAPQGLKFLVVVNLILSVSLSTIMALSRMSLLGTESATISFLVNFAQSIIILPMLITTFLLFRATTGIFVVLAIILFLLSFPFSLFQYVIQILKLLIETGISAGNFLTTRIISVILAMLELLISLLEIIIRGIIFGFKYLFMIIFFIPESLFKAILIRWLGESSYSNFLAFFSGM